MNLIKFTFFLINLSSYLFPVNSCQCEVDNIEPCPDGCVTAKCNMRDAICTCNTDCDATVCLAGYLTLNQNVCDGAGNMMETCQKTEQTFSFCDECKVGYFGYKCDPCECIAGEVCQDGLNGSGECIPEANMPEIPDASIPETDPPTAEITEPPILVETAPPTVKTDTSSEFNSSLSNSSSSYSEIPNASIPETDPPTAEITEPPILVETAPPTVKTGTSAEFNSSSSNSSSSYSEIPEKETKEPQEGTTEDLGATDDSGGNGMSSGSLAYIFGGAAAGGLAFLGIGIYGFIWYRNHKSIVAAPDIMA